ncbi:hypothetical protein LTR78_005993 [Recurvomyces mirabilis]|uniref:AB hydrolase-1 domain-containing protein n=1 Tax=Recurvomyces mirabilis TaxID=574656 RepID=A0AAE0WLY4_9PEZI|nr:hypothetical protein LTR78_005993 [Recurvomyces mirabilis]KAK5155196.1 hypothetical protein LTS14_006151 [Recurvomyces mirabilis]
MLARTRSTLISTRQFSPRHKPLTIWRTRLPQLPTATSSVQRRIFLDEAIPTVLVPPAVFTGLLLGLWAYKCFMTVVFQDRIIYMPYMPPFARSEKIADYAAVCRPVSWREERMRSLDGTRISLCVGQISHEGSKIKDSSQKVVICYFQGNGGSTPARLPLLSQVLKLVHVQKQEIQCTLVALSYRGYWKSSGRATQKGMELDAQAMLQWVATQFPNAPLVLWGQSIGAGVASTAAATLMKPSTKSNLAGLIMETPFTSVASMLLALYPEKWLPYRYLTPFLWNHWDSEIALRTLSAHSKTAPCPILLMPATRDEVVPAEEIGKFEGLCKDLKLQYERKDVIGALHTEATTRREGQYAVAEFVLRQLRRDRTVND